MTAGNIRTISLATGALGVLGVAAVIGIEPEEEAADAPAVVDDGYQLCLKSDIPFFEGAEARCYSRADVEALRDAPLRNKQADKVTLMMADPVDILGAPSEVETCRNYDMAMAEGRFALSSRDMRREAFFVRACAVIELLLDAQPAAENYLAQDNAPSDADILQLVETGALAFGPPPAAPLPERMTLGKIEKLDPISAQERKTELDEPTLKLEKVGPAGWRIHGGKQVIHIDALADADFDGDSIAELAVFTAMRPVGGTASAHSVALLEKDAPESALVLTPYPPEAPEEEGEVY